jgi:hypothetical protein
LSRDKFINVSFWSADGWLYIYGSGDYRKSSVYLARVNPMNLGDPSQLQYFVGTDLAGQPQWSPRESDAVSLFHHDVVGEFSVAYLAPVNQYVMLYNSSAPRGIMMRSAKTPWGPWSEGAIIWEPWRDNGYGHFMHISSKFKGRSDTFSDPRRDDQWGGEYGPYIMARYTSESNGWFRIYFTMSTWNPYQVVVMRSDLTLGANGEIAAP